MSPPRRNKEEDSRKAPPVVPANAAPQLMHEDLPPIPIDPRHQEIYTLADQGRNSREIAQQLNRPTGEIDLILALRGRKNDAKAGQRSTAYSTKSPPVSTFFMLTCLG